MTAIKDLSLASSTVSYGGVVFGGTSLTVNSLVLKSTPPEFSINARAKYDDAQRVVVAHQVSLSISCYIYSDTAPLHESLLRTIRGILLSPRNSLDMSGVGAGFDVTQRDVSWGPRPEACFITPIGRSGAQIRWSVTFELPPCTSLGSSGYPEHFKAFNFSQSYSLDEEGLLTRQTSGYWEIAPQITSGNPASGNGSTFVSASHVSDMFRDRLVVEVPQYFRRVQQNYTETADKMRSDFSVIDRQEEGEALPAFIIDADGSYDLATTGPGYASANISFSAKLTVAPGVSPSVAAVQFFLMAEDKAREMRKYYQASGNSPSALIPAGLQIRRGQFRSSRTTSFSIQWQLVGCVAQFMADGLWKPLDTDYKTWRQSISYTWDPRGIAKVGSQPENDAAVNLCGQTSEIVISTAEPKAYIGVDPFTGALGCGEITQENSWLDYSVEYRVLKDEKTVFHRQAVDPETTANVRSSTQEEFTSSILNATGISLANVFDGTNKEDVQESTGIPEMHVLVKMRGLRVRYTPAAPALQTFQGNAVALVKEDWDIGYAFDVGIGCPVYSIRGWRLYRVQGSVAKIFSIPENHLVCGGDEATQDPNP